MKILILANNDLGLFKFRKELIQKFLSIGHEVYVSIPDEGVVQPLIDMGCIFLDTSIDRRGKNLFRDIRLFQWYMKVLKQIKPDLVITYTIKPNIYGGFACRIQKATYVVNITGLGSAIQNGGFLSRIVLAMYRIAINRAKVVFFENESSRSALTVTGVVPIGRGIALHGAGVNLQDYPYQTYPIDEQIRFLFVGRIMKEKGVDELFDAAKRIKNDYGEKVEFHLIGTFEEKYREKIDMLERTGILHFWGYQEDIRSFYKRSSCIVLPSYHEGMSNVLLEAAATGRPVITSDIPGCREAVVDGKTGYLCRVKDSKSLYQKMAAFITLMTEEREKMGAAGRGLMEAQFGKSEVVAETIKHVFEG